ncbi:MAG TPA: hypothetical protein VM425_06380 [Myxococcota bacterium]|nr:hypothetical protein [Myxococcota bacterium]
MKANISWCVGACVLTLLGACVFTPPLSNHGYPDCHPDGSCREGCSCLAGQICVPDEYGYGPERCREECSTDKDCQNGCLCNMYQCVPPVQTEDPDYCTVSTKPTCMPPDIWVDTNLDDDNPPAGTMTLRQALINAAETQGPHRIAFNNPGRFEYYRVSTAKGPLPPIPTLTYLDGGDGIILRPENDAGFTGPGLTVGGVGAVVSDIKVVGFPTCGLRISGDASDVHLFRMRIGDSTPGSVNGNGIEIDNGAHDVTIGRGRELDCVPQNIIPLANPPGIDQYDLNVIVANNGDGIHASNVDGLNIYGTWVGFDNIDDPGHHDFSLGNKGVGIYLDNVSRAVIGAQKLTDGETLAGPYDPLAGFVGVGRNAGGGVWVLGGGDISMPGLMLGDTPVMDPYDENLNFNLRIEANSKPVSYGPAPAADGPDALYFGLVYSESAVPIWIVNNESEVWIRGVQNECFQDSGCPPYGVVIENAHAPVKLHHLTFVYDFPVAGVKIEGLYDTDSSVSLVNSLLFRMQAGSATAIEVVGSLPGKVQLRHNMTYHFGDLCMGECEGIDLSTNTQHDTFICNSNKAIPRDPDCPNVDAGEIIDVNGHPMNQTGDPNQRYFGCRPDIGFIECDTPACKNVTVCD